MNSHCILSTEKKKKGTKFDEIYTFSTFLLLFLLKEIGGGNEISFALLSGRKLDCGEAQ